MDNKIKHENKSYINGEYVLLNALIYSKGCRSSRDLIKRKNVNNADYIYARLKDNEWIITDGKSVKYDKVFFSELFIKTISELNNKNEKIIDENGVMEAPNIIILEDNQKFRDANGDIIEIETRGERLVNNVYFRVKDVMRGFDMENLQNTIIDKKTKYNKDTDYKFFNCQRKNKIKKELFLTYVGILKVLYLSNDSRTKEINIVNNIISSCNNLNWICNKPLKCLYRPDMYTIINNNFLLLIEIDENQHKNYNAKEEEKRIHSIYNELNIKNMLIIRINSDTYKDHYGILHNSIDEDENEFSIRMNIIIHIIHNEINKNHENINIIKLFYDNYNLNNIQLDNKKIFKYIKNEKYNRMQKILNNFLNNNFIFQSGLIIQHKEIFLDDLGANSQNIIEVLDYNDNKLSCVYLFTLNTVEKLRESMNIDKKYADDSIVAKYGFTKNLARRTGEHITKYNKITNVDLKLKYYSYIDPQYMSNAETDIKDYMICFEIKFEFDKEDELVIIPKKLLKMVDKQYELIGKSYMGHISELITKNKDLDDKLIKQTLQHQTELQNEKHKTELQNEKHKNELQNEKHRNELQNKDLQILEYKIKFLEMQQKN